MDDRILKCVIDSYSVILTFNICIFCYILDKMRLFNCYNLIRNWTLLKYYLVCDSINFSILKLIYI
jgi:hypothetical protein